jgi:hypothetical protein
MGRRRLFGLFSAQKEKRIKTGATARNKRKKSAK